jgi:hypothetical protein
MNKVLLVTALLFFSGCASAHPAKHTGASVTVSHHPATIRVWVEGRWVSHGHHAYKTQGHWVTRPAPHRPGPHSKWVPGHYNRHGKWIHGRWR